MILKKILLVENEPYYRDRYQDILDTSDHLLTVARTMAEATGLIASTPFHLLVIDLAGVPDAAATTIATLYKQRQKMIILTSPYRKISSHPIWEKTRECMIDRETTSPIELLTQIRICLSDTKTQF